MRKKEGMGVAVARIGIEICTVFGYSLNTIRFRPWSALVLVGTMAGAGAVSVTIFAVGDGIRSALTQDGSGDVAVLLSAGARLEMESRLERNVTMQLTTLTDGSGAGSRVIGASSPEVVAVISQVRKGSDQAANLALRGVTAAAFPLRDGFRIESGRSLVLGTDEAIVGYGATQTFRGLDVGAVVPLGQRRLTVVGVFSAGGGPAESEIWTSASRVQSIFGMGSAVHSVRLRLRSPDDFWDLEGDTLAMPGIGVTVKREAEFMETQARIMETFVRGFGWVTVAIMGAVTALIIMNTMFGAVAARYREVGTLRALGFGRTAVAISVAGEAGVLAALGSIAGSLVAWVLFDGVYASTMNVASLSQVAFAFEVSAETVRRAAVSAILLGSFGGLVPAVHAVRRPLTDVLRTS